MDRASFQRDEPTHIRNRYSEEDHDYEAGRFKGYLRCDRNICGEIVVVAGNYSTEFHYDYDYNTDESIAHEVITYRPHMMSPAPEIISYPKALNKESKSHLSRAFVLFWVDYASCANRLRIVTEFLLDQLGIPRDGQKGKRKNARLDLADRIDLLKLAKPGHEDSLTALRYVGNVGSHEGEVAFEDLVDCFELLEDAMIELIEDRRGNLAKKAARLIAAKGKPSPLK